MAKSIHPHRLVSFDPFEVDLQIGELRNQGRKIPLQQKPFLLLALLLEKPGELLSREELQRKLWPLGINVDFDHNLNIIVARLR